jgi:hypothetical protein
MEETKIKEMHKYFSIELNNTSWDFIDRADELSEEDALGLVSRAHASLFHWSQIGEPVNLARGHYLVSRAYVVAGNHPEALRHSTQSLNICKANNIADFDIAFAYEAMARAQQIGKNFECQKLFMGLAKKAGKEIAGEEDGKIFFDSLKTIPGYQD